MKSQLEAILERVRKGTLTPHDAMGVLKDYPYEDLDFAKIDHHRELRKGFPEVIYGLGKTDNQIVRIAKAILAKGCSLLVTRIEAASFAKLKRAVPKAAYNADGKIAFLRQRPPLPGKGRVFILTAGTSDMAVAEEARVTCEMLGNKVERAYDVGVAGLHRLLGEYKRIKEARVIITCAGMEGALPSVVAGLFSVPIIAVPTSVGYGASFKGVAALLAMLNSCPGGVGVVNIDNGFGAAYLASLINHL
ncbi:MAG: nickel pincer cofactor biosynthesis protein LarB [Candidatus Aminicenantes bacterium]|nr:nickel pincer cofactor biosynthesis protein LarB [Candidatus Aminicenantes bacterium]